MKKIILNFSISVLLFAAGFLILHLIPVDNFIGGGILIIIVTATLFAAEGYNKLEEYLRQKKNGSRKI
jgi:hypothetical protein